MPASFGTDRLTDHQCCCSPKPDAHIVDDLNDHQFLRMMMVRLSRIFLPNWRSVFWKYVGYKSSRQPRRHDMKRCITKFTNTLDILSEKVNKRLVAESIKNQRLFQDESINTVAGVLVLERATRSQLYVTEESDKNYSFPTSSAKKSKQPHSLTFEELHTSK